MKPIWLWAIFFLAYALFSMKTHAAEAALTAHPALTGADCPGALCQGQ